jgi:hypothetical protein
MVPSFWPKVVLTESHYDPLALHDDSVNKPVGRSYYPPTMDEAERIATGLMSQGHSVGVGLSQLTAKSPAEFLSRFGLTIREALEPCRNMRVGAKWYVTGALSTYNTGSPTRGVAYAQAVMTTEMTVETKMTDGSIVVTPVPLPPPIVITPGARDAKQPPPAWDVWANEAYRRQQATEAKQQEPAQ